MNVENVHISKIAPITVKVFHERPKIHGNLTWNLYITRNVSPKFMPAIAESDIFKLT